MRPRSPAKRRSPNPGKGPRAAAAAAASAAAASSSSSSSAAAGRRRTGRVLPPPAPRALIERPGGGPATPDPFRRRPGPSCSRRRRVPPSPTRSRPSPMASTDPARARAGKARSRGWGQGGPDRARRRADGPAAAVAASRAPGRRRCRWPSTSAGQDGSWRGRPWPAVRPAAAAAAAWACRCSAGREKGVLNQVIGQKMSLRLGSSGVFGRGARAPPARFPLRSRYPTRHRGFLRLHISTMLLGGGGGNKGPLHKNCTSLRGC